MKRQFLAATALALTLGGANAVRAEEDTKLVEPLAAYKSYVADNTGKLVDNTKKFVDAIKAGDLATAKALLDRRA
ncbi:MAG: hypothetical protein WDN31_04200 [Hyphomicrobium sp.]